MNEPLTKENLQHIESLLLSGDATNTDLGLLLAVSQEIDLEPMMDSAATLCTIFLSKGLNNDSDRLLRLTKLSKVSFHVGINADFDYELKDDEAVGYIDNFKQLPEDWTKLLPNLEQLTICGGATDILPDEIGHLSKLHNLYLYDVTFKKFPPSFKNLQALKILSILHPIESYKEDATLFALPEEICELEQLEELHIESCLLSFIPEQIQQLPALRKLYINCDPEALFNNPKAYKSFCRRKTGREALHFVPNTLSGLPRLEELTLLLPSKHFPLSEQLFQNSHLRRLQLSSRLVAQLPLHSKELGRLSQLQIFKPTLLQFLQLTFALPETQIDPMYYHYSRSVLRLNLLLLLFYLPAGAWYFSNNLLINQLILPPQKGYSSMARFSLALLLYPIAFLIFMLGMLYWGIFRMLKPVKKASQQRS